MHTTCERCHGTGIAYWDGERLYCPCPHGDIRKESDTVRATIR